jgi:iron complex outermembrane receptor protein
MKKNTILKKAKILVPFLFLLITSIAAQAQTSKISGTVLDENQHPLAGATVLITDLNIGTTTNFDGEFEVNISNGNHVLEISYIGFKTLSKSLSFSSHQKLSFTLTSTENILDEVLVSAVRVKEDAPVTHSNLNKKEIAKRNLGQDIPILMNYLPSVVTTSDAGAGVGYTGIRVRGSDATRVNVTINGIPYNDSESMGTYWVNMGDFASSVENLQLQRGVGTSTNGAGAFGASLNMLTDAVSQNAYGQIATSAGSYGTLKNTVKFSTGKLNNHFELAGRVSKIQSDGYIDRASSNLSSYFFQASYVDENTLIKALVFGGHEKTYQAWYGTPKVRIDGDEAGVEQYISDNWLGTKDAENLRNSDRRYNYYTYDNEVDNYNQDHYQLHWNQKINENWSTNLALHYTWGRGYYEQYKEGEDFSDYGLTPIVIESTTIESTDLIRRKWLDNDFYGFTFSTDYLYDDLNVSVGGALNKYEGDHFGEIIWARYASQTEIRDRYYDNIGDKIDGNVFAKINDRLSENLSVYLDIQYRYIHYQATGVSEGAITKEYNFFNPKAGFTYQLNEKNSFYASYARANREPNRGDFENGDPEPESLDDFELGWRFKNENLKVNSNIYLMNYDNQLVLSGAIDAQTGEPLRTNVGESYRLGIEIDAEIKLSDMISVRPNIALSTNKNKDFYYRWDGELKDFGNTNIAFSPEFIAGNILTYAPTNKFQLSLLSKYVGEQYMGNIDADNSKLASYFVNDLNATYVINTKSTFKSIVFTLLVNNIFNVKYISNGYYGTWDDDYSAPPAVTTYEYAGYYPQATTNFLAGVTLNF